MDSKEPARPALSDRVRSLRLNNRGSKPARGRWLPWIVSFVLLLTSVAFGYRAYRVGSLAPGSGTAGGGTTPTKSDSGGASAPPTAATTNVAATGEVVLQSKGYVIPISLVQVSPKVGGQLIWINPRFEEGTKFKAGDILARLEKVDYEADFKQALFAVETSRERYDELVMTLPEEVKQAQAELEESRQNATLQRLDVERNRRLLMGNAIAQRELEQTRYAYEATLARIKRLEATVRLIKDGKQLQRLRAADFEKRQAEAMLEKAKWRRDNTDIIAPVSGTILTKKAELGNIVNPSAFSSGISASLCDMADLTKLEIDLSVQERDIASVKVGQPCLIMPEAYKSDRDFLARHPYGYRGEVSRLMPTADRAKGAVPVRVRIIAGEIAEEEAGVYLRPDLSATVSFLRLPEKNAPAVTKKTEKQ